MTQNDRSGARWRSGTGWLWLAMGLCVVVSVGGIIYAACFSEAADGGRGGAVAVAITFAMLFLDRRTSKEYLEMKLPPDPTAKNNLPQDKALKTYLEEIASGQIQTRNAFAAMLDWEDLQKWPLAISSVIGTVVWGFGDLIAGSCSCAL